MTATLRCGTFVGILTSSIACSNADRPTTPSSLLTPAASTSPQPRTFEPPPWPPGWVDLGDYSLTIAAASECGNGLGESKLPDDLKSRSYTAMLKGNGGTVWVEPSGPGLSVEEYGQGFYGTLSGTGATFTVHNADDGQPIREQLSDSRSLLFEGDVVAAGSLDSRLAGTLSGQLILFDTAAPGWKRLAWCTSMGHHFALSR